MPVETTRGAIMESKVEPRTVNVAKDIPIPLMDTSKQRLRPIGDGAAPSSDGRMQYDGRSPFWDEDE
jgi:hypothetical protein